MSAARRAPRRCGDRRCPTSDSMTLPMAARRSLMALPPYATPLLLQTPFELHGRDKPMCLCQTRPGAATGPGLGEVSATDPTAPEDTSASHGLRSPTASARIHAAARDRHLPLRRTAIGPFATEVHRPMVAIELRDEPNPKKSLCQTRPDAATGPGLGEVSATAPNDARRHVSVARIALASGERANPRRCKRPTPPVASNCHRLTRRQCDVR